MTDENLVSEVGCDVTVRNNSLFLEHLDEILMKYLHLSTAKAWRMVTTRPRANLSPTGEVVE
jgi:hypothetical protein